MQTFSNWFNENDITCELDTSEFAKLMSSDSIIKKSRIFEKNCFEDLESLKIPKVYRPDYESNFKTARHCLYDLAII